jgi:hypothetical protein
VRGSLGWVFICEKQVPLVQSPTRTVPQQSYRNAAKTEKGDQQKRKLLTA